MKSLSFLLKRLCVVALCVGMSFVVYAQTWEPVVDQKVQERLVEAQRVSADDPLTGIRLLEEIETSERSAGDWFLLGNLLWAAEQSAAAENAYKKALESLPTYRDARTNYSQLLLSEDRPEDCISLLADLMDQGGMQRVHFNLLAQAAMAKEDWPLAETALRQVMLRDALNQANRKALVSVLLQLEKFDEANTHLGAMIGATPQEQELWQLYADLALHDGDETTALVRLETARRLTNLSPQHVERLSILYGMLEQPASMFAVAEERLALEENLDFRLRTAKNLQALGRADLADSLVTTVDESAWLKAKLGEDYGLFRARRLLENNRTEEATTLLRTLLDTYPVSVPTMLQLAENVRRMEKLEEAVGLYKRALRVDASHQQVLLEWALLEANRGQHALAEELLEKLVRTEDRPEWRRLLEVVRSLKRERGSGVQ